MNVQEVRNILNDITYKPNFAPITFVFSQGGTYLLQMSCKVQNADGKSDTMIVYSSYGISPGMVTSMDIELLMELVKSMIHDFERHETDEWLKYRGECVTDPHPSGTM